MNGRIHDSFTPEGRIAAVVMSVIRRRTNEDWWRLDYADFETILRPHVERIRIHAALHELQGQRAVGEGRRIERERFLFQQLVEIEKTIAEQKL
jgi:hypothetical protein